VGGREEILARDLIGGRDNAFSTKEPEQILKSQIFPMDKVT
jgi:hypothetical protein